MHIVHCSIPLVGESVSSFVAKCNRWIILTVSPTPNTHPRPSFDSYLHPGLRELCPQSKLFSDIYIRVMGFLKDLLQLLQLQAGKGGSVSSLLTAGYVAVTFIPKFIQFSLFWHPFHGRHPETVTVVHSSI